MQVEHREQKMWTKASSPEGNQEELKKMPSGEKKRERSKIIGFARSCAKDIGNVLLIICTMWRVFPLLDSDRTWWKNGSRANMSHKHMDFFFTRNHRLIELQTRPKCPGLCHIVSSVSPATLFGGLDADSIWPFILCSQFAPHYLGISREVRECSGGNGDFMTFCFQPTSPPLCHAHILQGNQ